MVGILCMVICGIPGGYPIMISSFFYFMGILGGVRLPSEKKFSRDDLFPGG
jgi:hypothetical protein